jgi:lipopolysaccharide transport system permease protein
MPSLGKTRLRLELLYGLTRREVLGRYRGSFFGLMWSLLAPLLMLGVYTFAFHELLGARWPGTEGRQGFATMMFAGLIIHGLLSECLVKSTDAISGNPNFVKRVVFPLTMLPLVPVFTALFHAALSFMTLCAITLLSGQSLTWTAVFLPLIVAPYVLFLCGLSWFLAAIGVYIRDIVQLSSMLSMAFLFLSPIFYPATAIPERYRALANANPVTIIVEQTRGALFLGEVPDWWALGCYSAVAVLAAAAGLWVFRSLRRGFADVV